MLRKRVRVCLQRVCGGVKNKKAIGGLYDTFDPGEIKHFPQYYINTGRVNFHLPLFQFFFSHISPYPASLNGRYLIAGRHSSHCSHCNHLLHHFPPLISNISLSLFPFLLGPFLPFSLSYPRYQNECHQ